MKVEYEKPVIVKVRGMNFPLEILGADGKRGICKQCSSCHACR